MRRTRSGAAIVTTMVLVTILTLLVGAAVVYGGAHWSLAYANDRSEAALTLAEGGINDELAYIAKQTGNANTNQISSQPTVQNNETMVYPGDGHPVWGRRSTVATWSGSGYPNICFWVYSSMIDGTTPWDGKTQPFKITSTGYVNGAWRRVSVKTSGVDIFSLYAIFALAGYQNNSNAVGLQNATVTVTGTAGTNGQVSNSSSTLVASNLIDANTANNPSGQFDSSNLAQGGTLYRQTTPVVFPTVTTVLARTLGLTWNSIATTNSNATGVYVYRSNAHTTTISSSNCTRLSASLNNMLSNTGGAGYTDSWASIGFTAGSAIAIQSATGTTPIQVTVAKANAPNSGDWVTINGVDNNDNANGTWQVGTVTNSGSNATYTLVGSSSTSNGTANTGQFLLDYQIDTIQNTTPITVNTRNNHGFKNGDTIIVRGTGIADGHWTVTGVSGSNKKQLQLSGSTANGTYSYNSSLPTQIQGYVSAAATQTIIFEPGDYYFTNIHVLNDSFTQLYIDPLALASGGTPGQVRFWVNDPNNSSTKNDEIDIPILTTSTDPQMFRLYYGQDKGVFTFMRPSSASGVFNVYGAVYAVTKQPGDTSSLVGTEIDFIGQSAAITLNGSLIADKVVFHDICNVIFVTSNNIGDPNAGAGIIGGYSDGG